MKHEYRVFPNGLRLVVNKTDSKLACVLVRVLSGIEHEKKREEGITSLVEKLLACGTKSYPSRKSLKSQIDSFGGILSVSAFLDCIEIAIQAMEKGLLLNGCLMHMHEEDVGELAILALEKGFPVDNFLMHMHEEDITKLALKALRLRKKVNQ